MAGVGSVAPPAVADGVGALHAVAGVQLLEELGRGAHAVVYRARRGDGEYAVKMSRTDVPDGAAVGAALRREAGLLACVQHPAVGRVFEVGEAGGVPYLVMELIEGRSLAQVLDGGPLPVIQVVRMGIDMAGGLTAAHRVGIVHRDVKPDNIMIVAGGQPKLVDFGLATQGAPAGDTETETVGTFAYAAPEQTGMLARPVDGRADLYALGVVMFECLTGVQPFSAEDASELVRLHAVGAVPDLSQLRADAPAALASIVHRLLAKDPDDRYQDGAELAADLGDVSTMLIGSTGDLPPVVQARRPLVGRTAELSRLRARWDQVRLGTGGVARVFGPAGSGKRALVDGLCAGVAAAGHPVLRVDGGDGQVPLAPLRAAFEQYLRGIAQLPAAERDAAMQRIRSAAGAGASVLQMLCPALSEVLHAPELPQEDRQDQLGAALVTFITTLAGIEGGLLLRVEDPDLLDPGTARMLRHLVVDLRQHPLLLLSTEHAHGTDDTQSWMAAGGRATDTRIRLKPLQQDAVTELATMQLGGGAITENLAAQLTARSGGNPLAVMEYLRAMLDAAVIRPHWGTWALDEQALDQLALPEDVLDLVVARIEALPAAARELLMAAAAFGAPFGPERLARVGQVDIRDAVTAVQDGLTCGVLETHADGYAFLHQQVARALLADIDAPARRSLHQRIAETLDAEPSDDPAHHYAVARHYRDGEPGRAPAAMFRACCAAAHAALHDQAPDEALAYLQLARAAVDAGAPAPDSAFYRACGLAELRVGRLTEAQTSLEHACALEPDPLRRGELLGLVAEAQHSNYASTQSVDTIRMALAELGTPLPTNPVALIVSTVLLFVAGVFVGRTGRGFGTVTGLRRERYRVTAGLYNTGAMGAAVGMQRTLSLVFHLRCLYLVNRLGTGPEYVRLQAALGLVTGVARWRNRSKRCFAHAYAAAEASGDPRLVATVAWIEATGADAVPGIGATTGNRLRGVLQEHGRWLGLPEYLGAVACVGAILTYRGYAHEAAAWYERGRSRMEAASAVPGNPIAMLGVMVAAAAGQRGLTDERLTAIRDLAPMMDGNPGQQINLLTGAALAGAEQADAAVLDAVSDEIRHRNLTPRRVWAQQRAVWLYLAWGRLAQCRTAPAEERAERLAAAQQAVAALGRAANTPALHAYHHAARAEHLHLTGADDAALRHLARAELLGQPLDLPLLSCRTAATRARVMRSLGQHAEAARQTRHALQLATEHGWEDGARSLRAEFRTSAASTGSARQSRSGPRTGSSAGSAVMAGSAGRRLAALQQVSLAAATILNPDQLARVALDETIRIFAAERAILFLPGPDDSRLTPHLGRGADGGNLEKLTGYSATLVEQVRDSGQAMVLTSGEQGAALGARSVVAHGLRSAMIAPLQLNGELLGVVYLDSRVAKGVFTDDDVDILTAITSHIAAAMLTARAAQLATTVRAAERRSELADTMRTTMIEISRTLDPATVTSRLLTTLISTVGADTGTVIDPDGAALHPHGDRPTTADPHLAAATADIDTPRFGPVAAGSPFAALLPGAQSWLAVPLHSREHHVGLLVLGSAPPNAYHDDDLRVAAALAEQGMVAYDNAQLFTRAEHLATTDALTALHNRRHFFAIGQATYHAAEQQHRPLTAIMLDIDHFKAVNDTHGHGAGDDVIHEVAARLTAVIRGHDLLGRYGGEEFALLLPDTTTDTAAQLAERLRNAIAANPIPTRAGPIPVTISLGTAQHHQHDTTLEALLGRADHALYQAKQAGRNRVAHAE